MSKRSRTLLLALAVVLTGISVGLVVWAHKPAPQPLPVLGKITEFDFVDQAGRPFDSRHLHGRPWVTNFVFTRCTNAYPAGTARMASLEKASRRRGHALPLVSFSMDPSYDTPAVLQQYVDSHGVDTARWSFVTGATETLRQTLIASYTAFLGPEADGPVLFQGTHFALVDSQMNVRGFYDSSEEGALERLLADVDRVN